MGYLRSTMKNTSIFFGIFILIVVAHLRANAQQNDKKYSAAKANDEIYNGNRAYRQEDYQAALDQYREGLKSNPKSYPGLYNSGNASFRLKHTDSARNAYLSSLGSASEKTEKAQAYHNIGNTYMEQKQWQQAIEAYKNALRQNPDDQDSKYNLAYARKMLKNNGGGGGKDNQDKKQQPKDQQKDKQNNQDKENQDKNQQQQSGDKKEEKDQEAQPQSSPGKISEKQAEKLLNALRQEEKKLQQEKKGKERAVPVKLDKDW